MEDNFKGRKEDRVPFGSPLVIVIRSGLVLTGFTQRFAPEPILIAMASDLGLMGVNLVYAGKRVISPVYTLDAMAEAGFLVWWSMFLIAA